MNAYADLTTLKSSSYLNITGTVDDTYLRKLLEHSSRMIDREMHRFFYVRAETRYYDGAGSKLFLPDDLLSITTLKTDDGSGTYENTFSTATAPVDYFLYPLNDYPKIRIEINPNGDYGSFASGIQKGVEIVGKFGYGSGWDANSYYDSTTTTAEELDATETGVDVTSAAVLAIGQTILFESEQSYITGIVSNTLTVRRGVNGTTAATHATGKTIYIYEYPQPIAQACLVMAMRAWKRKDSAYQDVVGSAEIGQLIISKGLDPDVVETIKQYRKWSYP